MNEPKKKTNLNRRRSDFVSKKFVDKLSLSTAAVRKSSTPKFTCIHTHPPRALIKCRIRVATERKINRHLKTSINTALCFSFFLFFSTKFSEKCLFYFSLCSQFGFWSVLCFNFNSLYLLLLLLLFCFSALPVFFCLLCFGCLTVCYSFILIRFSILVVVFFFIWKILRTNSSQCVLVGNKFLFISHTMWSEEK